MKFEISRLNQKVSKVNTKERSFQLRLHSAGAADMAKVEVILMKVLSYNNIKTNFIIGNANKLGYYTVYESESYNEVRDVLDEIQEIKEEFECDAMFDIAKSE
jgi:aspartokinase